MGQKINPNILRLGINKNWKTEFVEKKTNEFAHFTFVDLEVKSYLERFLNIYGFILHDYKIHHTNSVINIFISYAIKPSLKISSTKKLQRVQIVNTANQQKTLSFSNSLNIEKKLKEEKSLIVSTKKIEQVKVQRYLKQLKSKNQIKVRANKPFNIADFENLNALKMKNSIEKLVKGLQLFRNNKNPVFIHFECINKKFNLTLKQKKALRKKMMTIQKFKSSFFFKEGVNFLFLVVASKNSASLLANFISEELKNIKRHKFFMTFLKKTLTIMLNSTFSKVIGIRIKIKGRLNGAPRASHKIIDIGSVPIQTINKNVDFAESSLHDANGSLGVKVYVVNKTF